MKLVALILVFTCLIFVSTSAVAKIINVPSDSSTIQAGINGAQNGDTVLVAKGHYFEGINFYGKSILVASTFIYDSLNAIDSTIIDADSLGEVDTASVVRFVNQEDTTSKLVGFTIQNGIGTKDDFGYRYGGGVYCDSSSPAIMYNSIKNNTACSGGGICCSMYSSPLITHNSVSDNVAEGCADDYGGHGGGIFCLTYSSPQISNNQITGNYSNSEGGGIFIRDWSAPKIIEDTIADNTADVDGGGIFIMDNQSSPIEISNCFISGNYASESGGGIWFNGSSPSIRNNIFTRNSADGANSHPNGGGAIYCTDSHPVIAHNVIDRNSFNVRGGGIYVQDCSSPTIIDNVISNNEGAGIFDNGSSANYSITFNDVWNNDDTLNFFGTGIPPEVGDTLWGTNFNRTPCDTLYNIIRDPMFADTINYELACSSVCVEAGDSVSTPPAESGCRIDMGAHEFYHGFICGDVNNSGGVDGVDCVYLSNYLFRGGPAPDPLASSDVDHDRDVDVADLVYLVNYVYNLGPEPCCTACL